MINKIEQRVWFWRVVQCWITICRRRRFVFATMSFSVFIAMVVTMNTKPVFASRAIIRDDRPKAGECDLSPGDSVPEVICGPPLQRK